MIIVIKGKKRALCFYVSTYIDKEKKTLLLRNFIRRKEDNDSRFEVASGVFTFELTNVSSDDLESI